MRKIEWRNQYDYERDAIERAATDIDTGTESCGGR